MSYNSQYTKWRMEQVWLQRSCVSPNHLANWSTFERGYRVYNKNQTMILLWFKHGKRMTSTRGCKPKGKGFSFLSRNYGIAIRVREEKKQDELNCTCSMPHHLPIWWCKTHGEVVLQSRRRLIKDLQRVQLKEFDRER